MSAGRDDHIVVVSKVAFAVSAAETVDPFIGVRGMPRPGKMHAFRMAVVDQIFHRLLYRLDIVDADHMDFQAREQAGQCCVPSRFFSNYERWPVADNAMPSSCSEQLFSFPI